MFLQISAVQFPLISFIHFLKSSLCIKAIIPKRFFLAGERNVPDDFDDVVTELRILLNYYYYYFETDKSL